MYAMERRSAGLVLTLGVSLSLCGCAPSGTATGADGAPAPAAATAGGAAGQGASALAQVQSAVRGLNTIIAQRTQARDQARAALGDAQSKLHAAQGRVDDLGQQLQQAQSRIGDLASANDQQRAQLGGLRQQYDQAVRDKSEALRLVGDATSSLTDMSGQLKTQQDKVSGLQTELAGAQDANAGLASDLADSLRDNAAKDQQLGDVRKAVGLGYARLTSAADNLSTLASDRADQHSAVVEFARSPTPDSAGAVGQASGRLDSDIQDTSGSIGGIADVLHRVSVAAGPGDAGSDGAAAGDGSGTPASSGGAGQ